MQPMFSLLVLLALALAYQPQLASSAPAPPQAVEVTYLGNEGVLLSAGGKQVAIDALHREFPRPPHYTHLPPAELRRLEEAQPPFDKIDVALFTHVHLDHFHPQSVSSYLGHNRGTMAVMTREAVRELETNAQGSGISLSTRIYTPQPQENHAVRLRLVGIAIKALGIPHGGRRAQHLAYMVEIGGKRVLHVGDAEASALSAPELNLAGESIDLAFLPYWMLLDADDRAAIARLNFKKVVAIHVPPGAIESVRRSLQQVLPQADLLTVVLEKKTY